MADVTKWLPAHNPLTEDIPAGGLVTLNGIEPNTGAVILGKPIVDSDPRVAVVGMATIPSKGLGQVTLDNVAVLSFDVSAGRPFPGDGIGAAANSFLGKKGNKGFRSLGGTAGPMTNVARVGNMPTVYRDECYNGLLTRMKSTDGGATWEYDEQIGCIPCGPCTSVQSVERVAACCEASGSAVTTVPVTMYARRVSGCTLYPSIDVPFGIFSGSSFLELQCFGTVWSGIISDPTAGISLQIGIGCQCTYSVGGAITGFVAGMRLYGTGVNGGASPWFTRACQDAGCVATGYTPAGSGVVILSCSPFCALVTFVNDTAFTYLGCPPGSAISFVISENPAGTCPGVSGGSVPWSGLASGSGDTSGDWSGIFDHGYACLDGVCTIYDAAGAYPSPLACQQAGCAVCSDVTDDLCADVSDKTGSAITWPDQLTFLWYNPAIYGHLFWRASADQIGLEDTNGLFLQCKQEQVGRAPWSVNNSGAMGDLTYSFVSLDPVTMAVVVDIEFSGGTMGTGSARLTFYVGSCSGGSGSGGSLPPPSGGSI